MSRAQRFLLAATLAAVMAAPPGVMAAHARKGEKAEKTEPAPPPPTPTPAATPASPPDSKPYDPELLRLAEAMGALTTMRQLCGAPDADTWRGRMQALLDAEGSPPSRKDRLAGAFNRGLQGYALTYRTCTPNARLVIRRFLDEASRIARDLGNRYRSS